MKNKDTLNFFGKNAIFFVLSKGVAFLAPLLLVKFVSIENYGLVEYSYAMGSVFAVALVLGLNGAYPYFILKRQETNKQQAFFLYGLLVFLLYLLFAVLFYCGIINVSIYYIFLFSAIFAIQRLYSSILKSHDKGYLGVLFDGGYYFILTAVILLAIIFHGVESLSLLRIGMELYLAGLILLFFHRFEQSRTMSVSAVIRSQYPTILRYSLNLVLSGFIIYWLTSSARIYIKYLMGYEQVGIYSFYFRLAGIAVIMYQFCYIAYFKKLYLSNHDKLDRYFSMLIVATMLACVSFYVLAPLVTRLLNLDSSMLGHDKLLLLLSVQMPLWVGISLNEGVVSRENAVMRMNVCIGSFVILFLGVMLLFKNVMTLELFTYINILLFSISYWSQTVILKNKNIPLHKCRFICIVLMTIATMVYFIV